MSFFSNKTNTKIYQSQLDDLKSSVESDIETLTSNVETNRNNITAKQDKINILTPIICNTLQCSDVKLNSVWLKQDISDIKKTISDNSSSVGVSISELATSIDETKNQITDLGGVVMAEVFSNFRQINKIVYSDYYANISGLYTFSKIPVINSTEELNDNSVIKKSYVDGLISAVSSSISDLASSSVSLNSPSTFSEVITFSKYPQIVISGGAILSDFSVVPKKYMDDINTSLSQRMDGVFNITDVSIKGIHTRDREDFEFLTTSIPANSIINFCNLSFSSINNYSRLNCIFNIAYRFTNSASGGADSIRSYAQVWQNNVMLYQSYQPVQYFNNTAGGGSRSNNIFPLHWTVRQGVIGSAGNGVITIKMFLRNDSDDPMQVENNDGAWFQCTEIRGVKL